MSDRAAEARFSDAATQEGFTPLWNSVLRNAELSHGARLLYATLSSYAWAGKDTSFPGQERLSRDLGVSSRQVRTYTRELEAAGLVEVKRQGLRKPNLYLLHAPGSDRKPTSDQAVPDRKHTSAQDRKPTSDEEEKREKGRETSSLAGGSAASADESSTRKSEERETLYRTLLEVSGIDPSTKLPKGEARRVALAAAELKSAEATPETVRQAARAWPALFRDATITPQAIAKNYGRLLAGVKPTGGPGRPPTSSPAERKRSALAWATGRALVTMPTEDDFLGILGTNYRDLSEADLAEVAQAYRQAKAGEAA